VTQPNPPRAAGRDLVGGTLVVSCSRFARAAGRAVDVEVSTTMWRILSTLEHAGSQRISDLAAQERTAQPTISKLVKRLEGLGLVARAGDPADGRSTSVSITAAGRDTLAGYRRSLTELLAPHLALLHDDDLGTLQRAVRILDRLADTIPDGPSTPEEQEA